MARGFLHHQLVTAESAEPRRWLAMLHGIFGSGRNWAGVARGFVTRHPDWGVILVDVRGHGRSAALDPPHTLTAAAHDLHHLASDLGITIDSVLGHSFGGKVALQYATESPPPLRHVWVVDATPRAHPPSGPGWDMLTTIRRLPAHWPSRQALMDAMKDQGYGTPTATWMASNLVSKGTSYTWQFDIDAIEALLTDFFNADLWPLVENPPSNCYIHFIKAERSDVITQDDTHRITAAADAKSTTTSANSCISLHTLPGGHMLNVDSPGLIINILDPLGCHI
jgi:esterase